jgi:hypothetical protein
MYSDNGHETTSQADLEVELELADMRTLRSTVGATSMFELAQDSFDMSMFQEYGKLFELSL